ncbi:hypothetical protein RDV78_02700 [Bacillota bacterium LX-D]|nr:hypothetical protein [Bacillota bacterium LX-D]
MLHELIKIGETIPEVAMINTPDGLIFDGDEYRQWINDCLAYLESHYTTLDMNKYFKGSAEKACGSSSENYNNMMNILRSLLKLQ